MNDVQVLHGDALELLPTLEEASVDAVCTDPPYNLSFMAKPWDAYDGREDAGFAYWLTGLIDGEGHFAIKAHTRGTHAPYFALKMRADERGVLERIQRSMGVGTLRIEDRGDKNPMVSWIVQDKAGCQRLVDLLDKYPLRAKKRVDYWTWREAVCEWTARPRGNRWHGQTDNARMANLRGRLMETRAYADVPWSGHEFQDWCRLWATECLRALKPGGWLIAFGGTRTVHRLTAGIEDAGFEIRDSIAWLYGSGFPKSLDVSKAITATQTQGGANSINLRRSAMGDEYRPSGKQGNRDGAGGSKMAGDGMMPVDLTDDARRWNGWGTALKPAHEPIVVARKPLAGTVAANVLEHGTGALNIDGCRVSGEPLRDPRRSDGTRSQRVGHEGWDRPWKQGEQRQEEFDPTQGRWPPNVVLDEAAAAELDRQSGTLTSWMASSDRAIATDNEIYGKAGPRPVGPQNQYGDSGGASRFFPIFRYEPKAPADERPRTNGAAHPTVKPLELMRWLVRLVTPPGGLVLDPFAGSGTTGEACIIEDFRCVLIEREADYLPLIEARLNKPIQPVLGEFA